MKIQSVPLLHEEVEKLIEDFDATLKKCSTCSEYTCSLRRSTLIKDRFDREYKEFRQKFPLRKITSLTAREMAYDPSFRYSTKESPTFFSAVSGRIGHFRNSNPRNTSFPLYIDGNGELCPNKKIDSDIEVFANQVKSDIIRLVKLGREYISDPKRYSDNLREINRIRLGTNLKGKLLMLYTYESKYKDSQQQEDAKQKSELREYGYDNFLNIYSEPNMNRIIKAFHIKTNETIPEMKREVIRTYKLNHPIMKHWHLFEFAEFIYTVYPNIFEGNKSAFRN